MLFTCLANTNTVCYGVARLNFYVRTNITNFIFPGLSSDIFSKLNTTYIYIYVFYKPVSQPCAELTTNFAFSTPNSSLLRMSGFSVEMHVWLLVLKPADAVKRVYIQISPTSLILGNTFF